MRKIDRDLKRNFENDLWTKVAACCFEMDYYDMLFDIVLPYYHGLVGGVIVGPLVRDCKPTQGAPSALFHMRRVVL